MRRRWLARGLVAALAAVALVACGSDPEPGPVGEVSEPVEETTEDPEASDLPEGVPTAPPERPTPEEETLESAEAFGRYVLEVWWYTVLSSDASAMEELAAATLESPEWHCEFCQATIEHAHEQAADGLVQRPHADLSFRDPRSAEVGSGEYAARWGFEAEGAAIIDRDSGKVVREYGNPGLRTATITTMWEDGAWVLVNFVWDLG